jgi:hypothetical protein
MGSLLAACLPLLKVGCVWARDSIRRLEWESRQPEFEDFARNSIDKRAGVLLNDGDRYFEKCITAMVGKARLVSGGE